MDRSVILLSTMLNATVLHCHKCGARTYGAVFKNRGYGCRNCNEIIPQDEIDINHSAYINKPTGAKVFDNGDRIQLSVSYNTIAHKMWYDKEARSQANTSADGTKIKGYSKKVGEADSLIFQSIRHKYTWNLRTGLSYMLHPKIYSGNTERVIGSFLKVPVCNISFGSRCGNNTLADTIYQPQLAEVAELIRAYHSKKLGYEIPKFKPSSYYTIGFLSLLNRYPLTHPNCTVMFAVPSGKDKRPSIFNVSTDRLSKLSKKLHRGSHYVNLLAEMWSILPKTPRRIKKIVDDSVIKMSSIYLLESYTELKERISSIDSICKILETGGYYRHRDLFDLRDRRNGEQTLYGYLRERIGEAKAVNKVITYLSYLSDSDRMFRFIRNASPDTRIKLSGDMCTLHDHLSALYRDIKYANRVIPYSEEITKYMDHIDEYTFTLAPDTHSLYKCHDEMNICVQTYSEEAIDGTCIIVFVTKDGKFECCLEVSPSRWTDREAISPTCRLVQAKVFANQRPVEPLVSIIKQWCKAHNIVPSTCDLEAYDPDSAGRYWQGL